MRCLHICSLIDALAPRYMIKTQTKDESKLLRKIMPQYVGHLAQNPKSLLVRFYGMHRVKMSCKRGIILLHRLKHLMSCGSDFPLGYIFRGHVECL